LSRVSNSMKSTPRNLRAIAKLDSVSVSGVARIFWSANAQDLHQPVANAVGE
jgi:hypothetical protein